MSDQGLKDLVASLAISQAKTDEELNKLKEAQLKTDEQLKKTDEQLKKLAEQVGGIGNNQGAVAEEYFYNSLKEKMRLLGMEFNDIGLNWRKSKNGIEDEFDIILTNGKTMAIIEVKYKAHEKDIDDLVNKKHKNFNKFPKKFSVGEK